MKANAVSAAAWRSLDVAKPRLPFVGRMENFAGGMNHPPTVFCHRKSHFRPGLPLR
jgi:hypothetical protein